MTSGKGVNWEFPEWGEVPRIQFTGASGMQKEIRFVMGGSKFARLMKFAIIIK